MFRVSCAALALAAAAMATMAMADGPQAITNPQWQEKPSGADLQAFYPNRARGEGVNGRATIECTVEATGLLTGCTVVDEAPEGYGFGEATVRASAKFRMHPRTIDGKPVAGAVIRIPMTWSTGSGTLPPRSNTLDPAIVSGEPVVVHRNSAFYPRAAAKAKTDGRAVVECLVTPEHTVADCQTLAAAPANQGFEQAARQRVSALRVPREDRSGETAGRKVRFPVYFKAAESRGGRTTDMIQETQRGIPEPPPPGRE
jgi:TonB family protein